MVLRLLCFKYKIKIFLYGYKVIFHLCSFQIADSQLFFNQFLLIYKRVFGLILFPIFQSIISLQNSSPAPRYLISLSIRTNLHKNLVGRYLLQIHPLLIFRYICRKYTCFSYRQFNGQHIKSRYIHRAIQINIFTSNLIINSNHKSVQLLKGRKTDRQHSYRASTHDNRISFDTKAFEHADKYKI